MKKQMATKIEYVSPYARQANGPMASKVEEKPHPLHYVAAIAVVLLMTMAPTLENLM